MILNCDIEFMWAKVYNILLKMKRVTDSLKKVFGRFDDSLINPPK